MFTITLRLIENEKGFMIMEKVNKFENPCSIRYKKRYESLPEDIKKQWDDIENLPNEKLYLKRIKRKFKPEIEIGTIFALKLPEDVFLFGKVVADVSKLPILISDEDCRYYVAFISKKASKNMEDFPSEITADDILVGPWIIGDWLWRGGKFYTVGQKPLTEEEKKIDYGFYKMKLEPSRMIYEGLVDNGYIVDINGCKMDHEPEFLETTGCITIIGIEKELRQEIIVNPSIIEDIF